MSGCGHCQLPLSGHHDGVRDRGQHHLCHDDDVRGRVPQTCHRSNYCEDASGYGHCQYPPFRHHVRGHDHGLE